MKILFLSRWYPYPITNGSKLRIYHLLKGLSAAHQVSLLCFSDPPVPAEAPAELKAVCAEVRAVEWREFRPKSWKSVVGLFSVAPRSLADTFSPAMAEAIKKVVSTTAFDLVICSQLTMTYYRELLGGLPVFHEEIEVLLPYGVYANAKPALARLRNGLTWMKLARYLKQLLAGQQACTVVSEEEKRVVSSLVPGNRAIHVVPNCIDLSDYAGVQVERENSTLIFTGSFRYRPNYEAVLWFLTEVFPTVQAHIPGACMLITGEHANLPLPRMQNVVVTGFVDDIRGYIARATASVVPLLAGGGTRLKILEAMALGTPVVSTSKGAEGLEVVNGRHLLIADSAQDFARQTVALLRDKQLQSRLSASAYRLMQEKYDWPVVMPGFIELVGRAAGQPRENITKQVEP